MTDVLVKSAVGPYLHCVNLLDEILCDGPDSLTIVAGGHQISFHAAIMCSLSPLLTTLVKQSTEDNCCSLHDMFVFLPQLKNWKTVKHLKTFLAGGLVDNISREEIDDLQNLLQMLGLNISCEKHPALAVVQDEEEQFFAEIKYEAEDEEELLEKQDLFTRIQLERNDYEEIKNLITSGGSALIGNIGNIDQEMMQDEHLEINYGDRNYNNENDCSEVTPSKGSKRLANRKTPELITPTIDDMEVVEATPLKLAAAIDDMEIVESAPVTCGDFESEQRSNSYSPCRNKTLPERPKLRLRNRKTKHSNFEITKVARKGDHYLCPKCNYKSRYKYNVKTHCEASHEGVKHSCTKCDIKTKHLSSLIHHIKSFHEGVKSVNKSDYNKCDYKVTQMRNLKRHVNSVHKGARFPCNECDYKATSLHLIKQHVMVIHEKNQYSCSQCDYKSKYMGELKRHIQSVHEEIRYPCDKCDFKSARKSNLVRHNKVFHEGVQYPCTTCDFKCNIPCYERDYKATGLHLLKQHVMVIHEKNRYSCSQCDYKSKNMSNLVRHNKAVHEGVQYPCTKCDFKCNRLYQLKKHAKSAHY